MPTHEGRREHKEPQESTKSARCSLKMTFLEVMALRTEYRLR